MPNWDFCILAGAGGLRGTATDPLSFLEGLMDPAGPLAPAMATIMAARDGGGLGLGLPEPEGHIALQHEGGTGGYRSYVGCVPASCRGAVVLSNASTGAVTDLGIHLCDSRWTLHWRREPVAVDPTCFDQLLGRYRMSPGMRFDVARERDRLMVQLTGQPAFRVFTLSEWQMFCKNVGAQLAFEPSPHGRDASAILHQHTLDQTALRVA